MSSATEVTGLPVCNFCEKTYDPHDRHICAGNHIEPPKASYKPLIVDHIVKQFKEETGIFFPAEPAKALTYDDGKAPLANLPWAAVEGMNRVQAYGHQKYKDFNNYRKGMEVSRNLSCALRHIKEYLEGHDVDAESKCHPLEHAMCRLAFVLQNIHDGKAIDDRFKP